MRTRRWAWVAATVALAAAGSSAIPVAANADPPASADADVVISWNAIAVRTLTERGVPVPVTPVYLAFVSIAVHDAVVTVEGGGEPYLPQPPAHRFASSEVAAATAAHGVLRHYFPASAASLDADYVEVLRDVPRNGFVHGVRAGTAAAHAVIAAREDDGRGDSTIVGPGGTDPGEWRPTPPGNAAMAVPWLGFVDTLVIDSPTDVSLDGPDDLDSAEYAADLLEVRQYGARTGSMRTDDQTATARFWNVPVPVQYQVAMRDQVDERGLDIVDTARAFAVLNTSMADAVIACWRAKYDVNFWRPVTAINLGSIDPDPDWQPLLDTPPYPDYPSGHACITGAASGSFTHLFGFDLDLVVPSLTAAPARTFATAAELDAETKDARIWLGFHFRRAMDDGNQLGHDVADEVTALFAVS